MKKVLFICDKFKDYCSGYFGHAVRVSSFFDFFARMGLDCFVLMVDDVEQKGTGYDSVILNFNSDFPEKVVNTRSVFHYSIEFIRKNKIDTVVSSSPPVHSHLIARELKRYAEDEINWVCDVRDLFSRHPVFNKSLSDRKKNEKIEAELLSSCDLCTTMSQFAKEELLEIAKNNSREIFDGKIVVIENGYLEAADVEPQEDFLTLVNDRRSKGKKIFIYSGSGTIGGNDQNKEISFFLEAIANNEWLRNKISFVAQGPISFDKKYLSGLFGRGVDVTLFPPVRYEVARKNMALCDVGVNLNRSREHASQIIGGKSYDYAASGLAVLFAFPQGSSAILDFSKKLNGKPVICDSYCPKSIDSALVYAVKNCEASIRILPDEAAQFERMRQNGLFYKVVSECKKSTSRVQAEIYDSLFASGGYNQEYEKKYTDSMYFKPWSLVAKILEKEKIKNVLDVGCGPGQFGQLIFENFDFDYYGIDISEVAVEKAKKINPGYESRFSVSKIGSDNEFLLGYDAYVSLEVLEHIFDDIAFVKSLPSGSLFVFSVPNFDSKNHVRFFRSPSEVVMRYSGDVEFLEIYECCMGDGKLLYIVLGRIV